MIKRIAHTLFLTAAAISISACEKTREQFDFSKKPPDEFAVVRRAPLEMPPDLSLRAPQPGAPRPQELSTTDMAREAVLGEDAIRETAKQSGVSQGEAVLLQRTGAAQASPAIRGRVDAETAEIIKDETPGIDKLKKWVGQNPPEPAPEVVDPVAEANRIKQNKAQGKPVNAGKTPTIED